MEELTQEEMEKVDNIKALWDAMDTLFHGFEMDEIMHAIAAELGELGQGLKMTKQEFLDKLRAHVSDTYDEAASSRHKKGLH